MNLSGSGNPWMLLIYQLPTTPSNIRVGVWRRLQKIGAISIKNSVYVLPNQEQTQEDFQWLKQEIISKGGDAQIFAAGSFADREDRDIEKLFKKTSDQEYQELIDQIKKLADQVNHVTRNEGLTAEVLKDFYFSFERLALRLDEIRAIDFFSAPLGSKAESQLAKLKTRLASLQNQFSSVPPLAPPEKVDIKSLKGKTWVTRAGLYIDRLASAWLIRRFIDPDACFEFTSTRNVRPAEGKIRFDTFEAEFGHWGEFCTFETFLHRLGLEDSALKRIAEIVHDIDLKDNKFSASEARGIDLVIQGLLKTTKDDALLLEKGKVIFDAMYKQFKRSGKGRNEMERKVIPLTKTRKALGN